MKSIKRMLGAGTAMLAFAGALAATTPAMAQSSDPTVVTQAELAIVEAEYGAFIDQAAQTLQSRMRTMLQEQAGDLPEHMRDGFKASFNQYVDSIRPRLRVDLSRAFAMTFTQAELENGLAVTPERQAVVGPRGRELGEDIGRWVAREAWLKACDDAGASAATECANIRTMLDQIAPAK